MDIDKHNLLWFQEYAENQRYLKPLTEIEWSELAELLRIAQDRKERGDIVERLEKLAEKHGHVLLQGYPEDWLLGLGQEKCGTVMKPVTCVSRHTIPEALEAAEEEVENERQ